MLCGLEIVSEPAQAIQAGRVPDGVPASQPRVPCQPAEKGVWAGSHTWVPLTANLDARVVSAELAVDSSFPHNTAGALASTHLHIWQ